MTGGTGEKDDGIGITTETMIGAVAGTETGGGGGVTVMITTTGGGDAIAMTDLIGTAGIADTNR
jgi:hypothetical protein